ncbi:hypothetical protein [Arcobacter roscoffensis]|nr:hypothetical protein [Arcobacter roscoffensis]
MKNINETNLYKKNIKLQNNLFRVYALALILGTIIVVYKGFM